MKSFPMFGSGFTVCLSLGSLISFAAEPGAAPRDIFKTAIAVWQMGDLKDAVGKNDLTMV